MNEESKLETFSTEMGGRGLKASWYNNQPKFPRELCAEEPHLISRTATPVSKDGSPLKQEKPNRLFA
jgi:hypothetical protein